MSEHILKLKVKFNAVIGGWSDDFTERYYKHQLWCKGYERDQGGEKFIAHIGEVLPKNLRGVNLFKANLSEADLREADLSNSVLVEADLTGADLKHADLRNTLMMNSILEDAILRYANLYKADISYSYVENADFDCANLLKTQMHRLSGAITEQQFAFCWNKPSIS